MGELELIMKTISTIGDGARWMFYMYIAKEMFRAAILGGLGAGFLWAAYTLLNRLCGESVFVEDIKSVMSFRGYLVPEEKAQVLDLLKANKRKKL